MHWSTNTVNTLHFWGIFSFILGGVLNKAINPLMPVGYKMIITNSALCALLAI